ncbi:Uncharacterized protein TCM_030290 [Theobroma cacao]|uniref:Uncharacterized protein n=1 Tax=Theobroma cacao TaxID=3641 RepID=A0A061GGV1_THECC|nr:Uncharacterized protein TCM_030290 [Theobroma cacao]
MAKAIDVDWLSASVGLGFWVMWPRGYSVRLAGNKTCLVEHWEFPEAGGGQDAECRPTPPMKMTVCINGQERDFVKLIQ